MTRTLQLAEVTDVLFARAYAYDILRRFFIEEPSEEYVKHFVQQKMIHQFPFIDDAEGIQTGVDDVLEYLENFDPVNKRAHFEDLHWDYTRMLIGPFDLPVPPWESIYVRKDQLLFQGNTMSVRKQYEKFGFEVADYNIEADDHIGLELDFMYHLTKLSLQSAEKNGSNSLNEVKYLLQTQTDFLEQHLLKFAPELCEKMVANANTKFYEGIAKILQHYLIIDSQVLKELLKIDIIQ